MTTVVTLPQAMVPIGWAMIQGQKVPVQIDPDWMKAFFGLLNRTGGTANDIPFATNAGHATSADAATSATSATSATTATSAGHATTADSATTATSATSATTASNLLVTTASVSGYTTGAGGTITQVTNKTTGVTLDKPTGQITMNNAAIGAGVSVIFTLTNAKIAATDIVTAKHTSSGTANAYTVDTLTHSAGSVGIRVTNITGGSLSEAIVLNFEVWKGAAS